MCTLLACFALIGWNQRCPTGVLGLVRPACCYWYSGNPCYTALTLGGIVLVSPLCPEEFKCVCVCMHVCVRESKRVSEWELFFPHWSSEQWDAAFTCHVIIPWGTGALCHYKSTVHEGLHQRTSSLQSRWLCLGLAGRKHQAGPRTGGQMQGRRPAVLLQRQPWQCSCRFEVFGSSDTSRRYPKVRQRKRKKKLLGWQFWCAAFWAVVVLLI